MTGGDLLNACAGSCGHLALSRGGIIRSSVETRYQLGLFRQVASLIAPPRASSPHGTCESAMNAANSTSTSAANESWKLLAVEEKKSILLRQDWRLRSVRGEALDQGVHRLARVRCEGRDVDERRHVRVVASFGDHRSAIGMTNENDRLSQRVDDALGRDNVALKRERRILDDADLVAVLRQLAVDALPS
jgi:hypothetical protein